MQSFARKYKVLSKHSCRNLWIDQDRLLMAFEKGGLIYLFSFNKGGSIQDLFVPVEKAGIRYKMIFTSAQREYAENEVYPKEAFAASYQSQNGTAGFMFGLYPLTFCVFRAVEE